MTRTDFIKLILQFGLDYRKNILQNPAASFFAKTHFHTTPLAFFSLFPDIIIRSQTFLTHQEKNKWNKETH